MARQAMKMVLSVDGMTCGGCVEAVKRVILKADPCVIRDGAGRRDDECRRERPDGSSDQSGL